MLKLHQLFLLKTLLLFATTFLFSAIVSYFAIKEIELSHFEEQLKNGIELFAFAANREQNLESLARKVKEVSNMRLTVVDENGTVVAESERETRGMESHANRAEIMEARRKGYGKSIRYSSTLKTNFMYVAKKVMLGKRVVYVRMAIDTKRIMADFYLLWAKVALIFFFSIVIGVVISYNMSKHIKNEIDKIKNFLQEIDLKNFQATLNSSYAYDFAEIADMLRRMARKLEKREKKKKKYASKLKQISQQRADIISAISHEFKNPVAAIMGYAQTLIEDRGANEKIRERFLERILQNGKKIAGMIDRLTLAMKFETQEIQPKMVEFNILKLAQDVALMLEQKHKERKIVVQGVSRIVTADKMMIEMVLSNLIDNALKYSEAEVVVEVGGETINVIDKGIGIAPEEIEKITKKFYRINKNSWESSMGLGLALVEYILKLHNSHLLIESQVGEGSKFSFTL